MTEKGPEPDFTLPAHMGKNQPVICPPQEVTHDPRNHGPGLRPEQIDPRGAPKSSLYLPAKPREKDYQQGKKV